MESDYRDGLYESYVSGHQGALDDESGLDGLRGDVLPHLPARRDVAVLDVGCGRGQLLRLLQDCGYTDLAGIDLSAEQVELAHKHGTHIVMQADLFDYASLHAHEYDAVVALDVVEHFERRDVQRVFQTLADLLKPGGVLVLRTPNGASPYSGRLLYGDLTHGVIHTDRSLEQIGAAVGFASFVAYPVRPSRGGGVKRSVRRVTWRAIEALLAAPLIVETGFRRHIVTQNLIGVGRMPPAV